LRLSIPVGQLTARRGSAIARLLRPLHCPHLVMRYTTNFRFDAFAAGCLVGTRK
jgi:hypothetical protein